MNISISHYVKHGGFLWLHKFYVVEVSVKWTAAEKIIIKHHRLKDVTIVKRQPNDRGAVRVFKDAQSEAAYWKWRNDAIRDGVFNLKVRTLLWGRRDRHRCDTPGEAKNYDYELREGFEQLKRTLYYNAVPLEGTDMHDVC